jgi:hypothetical protein
VLKLLPKAVLLSLLFSMPVIAQIPEWQVFRDMLLGESRSRLMESCSNGRNWNSNGTSFWNPKLIEEQRQHAIAGGRGSSIDAVLSGQAAAMAIACPTVW